MERLRDRQPSGMCQETLRRWGMIFMAAGLLGRGVIRTHILGFVNLSMEQMLEQMSTSEDVLMMATLSLLLQAVEVCGLPMFALLLVEGIQHTRSQKEYLGRVLGLALICEIPYNLAMGGRILDLQSRNPVFGVLLTLVTLCFYVRYHEPGFKNIATKVVVTAAAVIWCRMLTIDHGPALVLVTASLWAMRSRPMYRSFVGMAVAVLCTVFSPFYMAAPMGFMAVHNYNGTRKNEGSRTGYFIYPVMLVAAIALGILGKKFF